MIMGVDTILFTDRFGIVHQGFTAYCNNRKASGFVYYVGPDVWVFLYAGDVINWELLYLH